MNYWNKIGLAAAMFAPRVHAQGYHAPSSSSPAGNVDMLLIIVIALVFLIVIGMFVGFMVMLANRRKAEEARRQREDEERRRHDEKLMSLVRGKDAQVAALEEQLKNISVMGDAINDVTAMLKAQGLSSISLIFVEGERSGMREVLDVHSPTREPKKCRIGRNSSICQVQIPDSDRSASGNHCLISFEGLPPEERFFVHDTEATNPTVVTKTTGKKLRVGDDGSKIYLEDGDIITVGRTPMRVVIIRPIPHDAE